MDGGAIPVSHLCALVRARELEAWMTEYVARGWDIPQTFVRQWLMARFGRN
jgi:hypothetical protein